MLHYTVPKGTNFDCTKASGTTLHSTRPRSTNSDCTKVAGTTLDCTKVACIDDAGPRCFV